MLDVDECMTQPVGFNCTQNHICINNDGSYGCICKPGYTGTAISCMGEHIIKSTPFWSPYLHDLELPFPSYDFYAEQT